MAPLAISAEGISKRYRLGERVRYRALRESIGDALTAPVRQARALFQARSTTQPLAEEIWSLRDVSFSVPHGEAVGIVGRNGAGKSTLLKVLSRITEPTEGRAVIRGRVGSLLEVGTGFHPELTGRENISLNGAILGMRREEIRRKFDEIVAFAEIDQFIDTPVKRYSSGMYVRLAFAVAAHLEPEILLVDEVLAVGDTAFQQKCLGKMGDVARQGRTVLFVSHSMPAVQALCTRAMLLEAGKLVSEGSTQDVIEEYLRRLSPRGEHAAGDLQSFPRDARHLPLFVAGALNEAPLGGDVTVAPESDLVFDLTLELPRAMRQAWLGITFENEMGIRVYALNTRWELGPMDLDEGMHRFRCTVPKLPLIPGGYYLSLGFTSEGVNQLDWLDRVARLEVARMDVYGTGALPEVLQGFYLPHAQWSVV